MTYAYHSQFALYIIIFFSVPATAWISLVEDKVKKLKYNAEKHLLLCLI